MSKNIQIPHVTRKKNDNQFLWNGPTAAKLWPLLKPVSFLMKHDFYTKGYKALY